MILGLRLGLALLSGGALAGGLAEVGESLPGAVVDQVEDHPEYQRYHLSLDSGESLQVEIVALGDNPGVCSANGLTLFPRWELLGKSIPEASERHSAVAALCERLSVLSVLSVPAEGGVASEEDVPTLPTLQPVWDVSLTRRWGFAGLALSLLVGVGVVAAAAARRSLAATAAVFLLSLVLRVLVSPRGAFNGGLASYEKLELALHPGASMYGGFWAALMGGAHTLLGDAPGVVFGVNLALAAAAPAALWALLRVLSTERVAWIGALGLMALPVHLKLSATEVMHIAVLTLELTALAATAGLAAGLRNKTPVGHFAVVAALATVAVLYTRPDALPFAALPPLWLALLAGRAALSPWALAVGGVSVVAGLLRASALFPDPDPVIQGARFAEASWWLAMWTPQWVEGDRANTLLHAVYTPPLVWTAALVGAASVRRAGGRVPAALVLWFLVLLVPVLPKSGPLADAWRLQLPAAAAAVGLAALGLAAIAQRVSWRGSSVVAALLMPALSLAWLPWVGARWAHQEEWLWLQSAAPRLEGPAVVYLDSEPTRAEHMASRLQAISDPTVRWTPLGTPPPEGTRLLLYHGVTCQSVAADGRRSSPVCQELWGRCRVSELETTQVTAETDADITLPAEPVIVGFYELHCPDVL